MNAPVTTPTPAERLAAAQKDLAAAEALVAELEASTVAAQGEFAQIQRSKQNLARFAAAGDFKAQSEFCDLKDAELTLATKIEALGLALIDGKENLESAKEATKEPRAAMQWVKAGAIAGEILPMSAEFDAALVTLCDVITRRDAKIAELFKLANGREPTLFKQLIEDTCRSLNSISLLERAMANAGSFCHRLEVFQHISRDDIGPLQAVDKHTLREFLRTR